MQLCVCTFDEIVASCGVQLETVGLVPIGHFTYLTDSRKNIFVSFHDNDD